MFDAFWSYDTVKLVSIQSSSLALLHRGVQAVVLAYVVGWVILVNKGYQSFDPVVASVSIKWKGNSFANNRVWDAVDGVVHPDEVSGSFVTTSFVKTVQVQGSCRGIAASEKCGHSCEEGRSLANGMATGACDDGYCEIKGWCPPEVDNDPGNTVLLSGIEDWTAFMRVDARFERWNQTLTTAKGSSLQKGYNLFTLRQILNETRQANGHRYSLDAVKARGATVAVNIHWDCNLDKSATSCEPAISFSRLDDPHSHLSSGYNIRTVTYSGSQRVLTKRYGVRLVFLVSGQAGKFDIVPLLLNFGSGLALMSVATIASDFIALYWLKRREFYKQVKYKVVDDLPHASMSPAPLRRGESSPLIPKRTIENLAFEES